MNDDIVFALVKVPVIVIDVLLVLNVFIAVLIVVVFLILVPPL